MNKIKSLAAIVDDKSTITYYGDDRKGDAQENNKKIERKDEKIWNTNES